MPSVRLEGRWRALLTEVIEEGRRAGELRDTDSPENAALALGALIDGLAVQVTSRTRPCRRERMLAICLVHRGDAASTPTSRAAPR